MSLDIPEPIYDKNGKLKNEKEVKDKLKKILPVIMSLWVANIAITNDNSSKVMINTNTYINAFKSTLKLPKTNYYLNNKIVATNCNALHIIGVDSTIIVEATCAYL